MGISIASVLIPVQKLVEDAVDDAAPGRGAGSALNPAILISAGAATFIATLVSVFGILLQLKNYRKPLLQRMTVRIMIMVPLYAISSLISLFSLDAAFAIDAIRDIYEAFVIYNFFSLIVAYLGGERSVLILLYGRPPQKHVFPVNLFVRELDASDPFTFLFLKRGILQYVQVKPVLAAATLILKATGTYKEGELSWSAGYLYVSFIYNASICLSLYCLAMFWVCVNADIKPFRPMPKFLCVKGILFFSFWQAISISGLVAAGAITRIGPYTDSEHMSLAITDTLICYEMPFFAFAHWYAFSHTDYIDKHLQYAARMPFYYAFRDAFGILDVLEDSRATLRGGVSYRTFEPVEGGMHQGVGRDRRIKAGLRYAQGGRQKYWIPMPEENTDTRHTGPISKLKSIVEERSLVHHGYAPLSAEQAEEVFHEDYSATAAAATSAHTGLLENEEDDFVDELGYHEHDDRWTKELAFDDPDTETERLYLDSRKLLFGDYHYPTIDVSGEEARRRMWDEEERILRNERAAITSPLRASVPHPSLGLLAGAGRSATTAGGGYGSTSLTKQVAHAQQSVGRSASDPDPRAARSALERQRLSDNASASAENGPQAQRASRRKKGVYGGWAEQRNDDPDSGRVLHRTNTNTNTNTNSNSNADTYLDLSPAAEGDEPPYNPPVIDYTPHEATAEADPGRGDIGLRYPRTSGQTAKTMETSGLGTDPGVRPSAGRRRPAPQAHYSSQIYPKGIIPGAGNATPPRASEPESASTLSLSASASLSRDESGPEVPRPLVSHVQPKPKRGSSGESSPLPPDAIDLVVEDVEAEEDEMTRERRKGEPAVRTTGERRVYRREYVVKSADGVANSPGSPDVDVDIQVRVDEEGGDAVEHTSVRMAVAAAEDEHEEEGARWVGDEIEESAIVRAATPPAEVHVDYSASDRLSNPWA